MTVIWHTKRSLTPIQRAVFHSSNKQFTIKVNRINGKILLVFIILFSKILWQISYTIYEMRRVVIARLDWVKENGGRVQKKSEKFNHIFHLFFSFHAFTISSTVKSSTANGNPASRSCANRCNNNGAFI